MLLLNELKVKTTLKKRVLQNSDQHFTSIKGIQFKP